MTEKELVHIITQGENETVEFKQSFCKAVIETLVAFSNNRGGKIIIGVDNTGQIKGVSITEESVQKWVNEIKQTTSPQKNLSWKAMQPAVDETKKLPKRKQPNLS